MTRCLIDINDAGIRISDASGLIRVSPGFAFLHRGELLTGEQAAARIRTNPRAGSDRFWHQLSQTPLPRPLGPARTHADLAWYHLRDLWTPLAADYDEVLLTLSGEHDAERLSTLLGIARACDMPVRSVVAAAVAAAASHHQHAADDSAQMICIDAQWHQLLLEPVQLQAGQVSLAATASNDVVRHGLAALYERWAHMIGEAFVQRTRFDPLHNAASEQQLYDALPGWLRQLSVQPQIQLKLAAGSHDFAVELEREQFTAAAADLYAPLLTMARASTKPLLLRQRLTLLPGLVEQLQQTAAINIVDDDVLSSYLLQSAAALMADDGDEVRHHLSLTVAANEAATSAQPAAAQPAQPPTHISDGQSLWPVPGTGISLPPPAPGHITRRQVARLCSDDAGHISIQTDADDAAATTLRINDETLSPQAAQQPQQLAAGDRISIDEQQFVLLRLVP